MTTVPLNWQVDTLQAPTNVGAIGYALLGEAFWAKWKNNACDLQRAFEQETKSFKLQ
jgi:hypothetical protein